MSGYVVEATAEKPDEKHGANPAYRVLYDGQCEVCQSCVSWLRTLDLENQTISLPISTEVLAAVDSRLQMDECLRQLHVVTPGGEIRVGWDAVACLARLFPSTWLIGALGQRLPFRNAGRWLYGFVAKNRYSLSKCRVPRCKTRSGTTASPFGRILVVLHTGLLHSVAAGLVGGHQVCGTENEYFCADAPQAT